MCVRTIVRTALDQPPSHEVPAPAGDLDGEGESSLKVLRVGSGLSLRIASLGDGGAVRRLGMTKGGSFKRKVRREARASGKPYTQRRDEMGEDALSARVLQPFDRDDGLAAHLTERYGIEITKLVPLALHGNRVFRVDR